MLDQIQVALESRPRASVVESGEATLPSVFDVSGLASATIGAAAAEVAEFTDSVEDVVVDRGLASRWFSFTATPVDFELPPVWDALAGDFECADGWIRLHTNAAHHRAALIAVLRVTPERPVVEAEVRQWVGDELEASVVDAGG